MTSKLYNYFERELLFMRQSTEQFAAEYPAAAGRLLLEPNGSVDPHVERMIEAFALLTGRVQKKLDDDFPQLTDALLQVLYPHYLAPVPSMSIVQFELDPANAKPDGVHLDRGAKLHTPRIGKAECQYRTCYPVTLWPLSVTSAELQTLPLGDELTPPPGTTAALRIRLQCQGEFSLADLTLQTLRFYLGGADELVTRLYELIFNHTLRVEFRCLDEGSERLLLALPPEACLGHVGFERDEGLLPYSNRSFLGYRLLREFFFFPYKFHFFDLGGWPQVAEAGFGRDLEIVLYLDHAVEGFEQESQGLEQEVDADSFRLGCAPLVNLFEKTAEPIQLTHARSDYQVVPDVHHPMETEIYSVDAVISADQKSVFRYRPFYDIRHDNAWNPREEQNAFWYASRRSSMRDGDQGIDVYLHLVDLDFDPRTPADSVLVVKTTCTNRDLPIKLQQTGDAVRFQLETAVPVKHVRCLRAPTSPWRPPLGRRAYWRLISHLTLNHLSLTDPVEGRQALQEMLRLYDCADENGNLQRSAVNRRLIEGITSLSSRRVVGRLNGATAGGFCRGVEVTVELDPQKYVGTGQFLFACVLERFMALYASLNSFTQLVARTKGTDGCLKKWPPRAGETQIL